MYLRPQAALNIGLLLLLLLLQWQLWFSKGGFWDARKHASALAQVNTQNARKSERNARAEADLKDLRGGAFYAESHARQQLDMVKSDELFIQVTPLPSASAAAVPASAAKH